MKASEVIQQLQDIIKTYGETFGDGDFDCYLSGDSGLVGIVAVGPSRDGTSKPTIGISGQEGV